MGRGRFAVMGAGEVGYVLAQNLSEDGHDVTLIDMDPEKRTVIEDELDLHFVVGNGSHVPVLEQARVKGCDLFIAASSSEEANLAASLLAKDMGAQRTAIRLATTEDLTTYRALYERLFRADLLLSPQILATHQILNHVLGHNTYEVDYLARGRVQLRKIEVQADSVLTRKPLRDVEMPRRSRIVGFLDGKVELSVVGPDDIAKPGSQALVVLATESIREVEQLFASSMRLPGTVVVAGAASTGITIATSLVGEVKHVKLFERDRRKARHVAAQHPEIEVIHGDATDQSILRAEGVARAHAFIGATGHDDSNLMAGLEAQELGVDKIVVLVERSETSRLWQRIGDIVPISARFLTANRISDYVRNDFKSNLVRFENGAIDVVQRQVFPESPVAGASLEDINPPQGLIVGAVTRGSKVFMPEPEDVLEAGDQVVLFVHPAEAAMVQLLFPGPETE